MKMYSMRATSSIHLRVDYRCSYCDQTNSDNSQYLIAKAESLGSLSISPGQADEAKQKAADKLKSQLSDIGQGKLQSAHLSCVCSSCRKKQVWASFIKYPVWTIVLFILGVALGIYALSSWGQFELRPQQLIIPLMTIPFIVIAVHNRLIKSRISRLDPKYLPKISILSD